MHGYHQVITGTGSRDVQEPAAFACRSICSSIAWVSSKSLVDIRFDSRIAHPSDDGNRTSTPRGDARSSVVSPDRIAIGKLESLRAVDGQDPHRVVVGLGQHRFDHPGALTGLSLDPLQVLAQGVAAGLFPCAALVEHETQSSPQVAGTAFGRGEFEEATFAKNPLEHLARRHPVALPVLFAQPRQPLRDRVIGRRAIGKRALVIPAPTDVLPPDVQIVVAAAERRGSQRADDGQLIGGVVDRMRDQHQIAHFTRPVDQ